MSVKLRHHQRRMHLVNSVVFTPYLCFSQKSAPALPSTFPDFPAVPFMRSSLQAQPHRDLEISLQHAQVHALQCLSQSPQALTPLVTSRQTSLILTSGRLFHLRTTTAREAAYPRLVWMVLRTEPTSGNRFAFRMK